MQYKLSTALTLVSILTIPLAIWASIPPWDSIEIHGGNIAEKQTHQIRLVEEDAYPHGLSIRIKGEIDGIAEITTHHDSLNSGQTVRLGPGRVSEQFGGDYYDSDAEIIYNPISSKKGKLKVQYKFHY